MDSATKDSGAPLTTGGLTDSDRKLRRELSFTQLLMLSLGGIIGSGWLFAVLGAAGMAGPAVVFAWIIGGILVLFIALTYAEVSGMLPRSGAIVRYPHLTHGSYAGYILGWAYLLSAVSVPAIEAIAVVGYASTYIPALEGPVSTNILSSVPITVLSGYGILLALALMVAFFFINWFGIRFLGTFNQAFTWWKLIIPVLTFLFLFAAFHGSNFTVAGFAPMGWAPVFEAIPVAGIVFSYLGFRQALDFGGEAKNPQRDVPRATILSVVIGIVVYTLLQIAFIGGINWGAIGIPAGDWGGLGTSSWASAPFYDALSSSGIAFLGAFASLLLVDAWVSPSGTGWVYMGTGTRTFYGLSAGGYFGSVFLRLSKKYAIPWVALVATLIVGSLFLIPFPSWYLLVGFISSATVFTYVSGGVGLQVFRMRAPQLHRPFRLPAAVILAPIAFVAASLIVYWSGFQLLTLLMVAIFFGLPIYVIIYGSSRLGLGIDMAMIIGITTLSLLVSLVGFWYFDIVVPNNSGAATGAQLAGTFWSFFVGLAVLMLGVTAALYAFCQREKRPEILGGVWLILFMLGLLPLSYFGAFGYDVQIAFPWDTGAAIVLALVVYVIAVLTSFDTPELRQLREAPDAAVIRDAPAAGVPPHV